MSGGIGRILLKEEFSLFAGFGLVSCSEQRVNEEREDFCVRRFGGESLFQSSDCRSVLGLSPQGISARDERGAGRAGYPKRGEGIEGPDGHADDEQWTEAGKV